VPAPLLQLGLSSRLFEGIILSKKSLQGIKRHDYFKKNSIMKKIICSSVNPSVIGPSVKVWNVKGQRQKYCCDFFLQSAHLPHLFSPYHA
jgi:hypothetical protein